MFSFGLGSGHIWLDDVHCNGSELFIQDCQHLSFGENNCAHFEDASVVCARKCVGGWVRFEVEERMR